MNGILKLSDLFNDNKTNLQDIMLNSGWQLYPAILSYASNLLIQSLKFHVPWTCRS